MKLLDRGTKSPAGAPRPQPIDDPAPSRVGRLIGPVISWIVVGIALLSSVAILASGITAQMRDSATAALPENAESAQAARLQEELSTADSTPVFAVLDRGGDPLTDADRALVADLVTTLAPQAAEGQQTFPVFSDDGEAAFVAVPLPTGLAEEDLKQQVTEIRQLASADLPDGLRATVTGGPAFTVDLTAVFDGADVRLLAITAAVVALLLLITYRSPWLWLVPLLVVVVADQVAAQALAAGTHVFGFAADGATTGITSVLVFGAGTNYALLLIARYREELRRQDDRYAAMRSALRGTAPAVLASSGTVILALLCLSLASSPFSASIGAGGAIGIAIAVIFALAVLPAALTLFGRGLFWPFVPRVGQPTLAERGFWAKVGPVVTRRPAKVLGAGLGVLAVLALPLAGLNVGLSQTEQFRAKPDSVIGQQILAQHFAAGATQPTSILVPDDDVSQVRSTLAEVDGLGTPEEAGSGNGITELTVVLDAEPNSRAAFDLVTRIRAEVAPINEAILVGGPDAQGLDAQHAAAADRRLIIPLILIVVLGILLVVLRSLVAAVLLILTVVASYAASLGASWWAFEHWFGFPALDLGVPLLSFLFLVALGVDYNIFLTTRAREEAADRDAVGAIHVALAVTGGVITSAGILLAAVFTVLGVLPLITLTQLGVIVGFGVLLDTLLVRTLLVPALVALCGERFWWPGNPSQQPRQSADTPPVTL